MLHLCALPLLAPLLPPLLRTGLTWSSLVPRVAAEVEAGFSGALLVLREGEVVLRGGWGLADRADGVPIDTDTVFAIGSTPIDFTKAACLLLMERGELRPDETLGAFFDEVPADKRAITVRHLMTGGSGLRDFHDLPTDRDPDHGWIDRAEAVRRILAQELLFAPGTGEEHSHSAWGLLAAIVELRSGATYPAFVREHLLEPAGMEDTGFFGEEVPRERLALGYGDHTDGEVNAPPYWGPTSWLVMGSGGMTSTAEDMLRWNRALRDGRLLSAESLATYWSPRGSVLAGGDAYGFEIVYTEGPGSLMILVSNAVRDAERERFQDFALDLARLVNADTAPPFALGVQLRTGEQTTVAAVMPEGAAARAGVRDGDVWTAIAGEPLVRGTEPMRLLARYLESGAPFELTYRRGAEVRTITLQPAKRDHPE